MSASVTNDDFIEDLMKKLFNEGTSENKDQSNSDRSDPLPENADTNCNKRSKVRDLIPIVLQASLKVEKIQQQRNENGDLTGWANFIVPIDNLGLTKAILAKYRNEIYSAHFASFIAEVIIYENIDMFINQLSDFNVDSYDSAFSGLTHGTFGLNYVNEKLVFIFHVSYINNLLVSDFKKRA